MEAVVLGNGGANHTATLRALVEAWLAYLAAGPYQGGCFFASAGHDFIGRPGAVPQLPDPRERRIVRPAPGPLQPRDHGRVRGGLDDAADMRPDDDTPALGRKAGIAPQCRRCGAK